MSFRFKGDMGRNPEGNPNEMKLGEPRMFGMEGDKPRRDEPDDRFNKFDSNRGRRPPFGRGRRPSPGRDKSYNDRPPRDFGFGRDEPPIMRDRSPLRGGPDDRYKKEEMMHRKREDMIRKDPLGRPFYDDHFMGMEGRSRFEGPGNFNSRFEEDQYKHRPFNYHPNMPPKSYFNEGFPKPNECEIIVINKQQRLYAESVEARIKNMGILVDVLFLKDEALLAQTIDDIARRGSLYAMVISPQNETHRSVTVNILHGTPQEHRNMPLDDALKLVSRNFHEHIRLQKETMERERAERGPYSGGVAADREIQFLLRMLADGRWISLSEINGVIRYLTERRDKMQGDRPPISSTEAKIDPPLKPKDDIDVSQKEQDLQNRIINIMNQGAAPATGGENPPDPSLAPNMDLPGNRSNQPRLNPNMRPPQSGIGSVPSRPNQPIDDSQLMTSQQEMGRNLPGLEPTFTTATGSAMPPDPNAAKYINFDDPNLKQALDNLIQSGPNILKNISMSGTSVSNPSQNTLAGVVSKPSISGPGGMDPNVNLAIDSSRRTNMIPPRGPGGMPEPGGIGAPRSLIDDGIMPRGIGNLSEMGGMGPQRGGGMSDFVRMGQRGPGGMPDPSRMGHPGGNMGGSQLPGLGRGPSPNIGSGGNFPGSHQFGNFSGPGQQGNFPGPSYNSGPNMMGNPGRSGGFGGNQNSMMGGGPRRY